MIPEIDEVSIASMEIKELKALFDLIEPNEIQNWQETHNRIKNGIKLPIYIQYLTNQHYQIWSHLKKIKMDYGEQYNYDEFMEEIAEREKIIRQTLLQNQDEGTTEPR